MQRGQPYGLARLAGVIGGLTGFAIADLASWFLAPAAAPLTAVGSAIIDLLPAPLINWGKETLGTADKPVLLVIIGVSVLIICAVAGQLELRRRWTGLYVFGAVALVGMAAVISRLPGQWQALLPTLIGLSAGYLVVYLLITRLARSVEAAAELDRARARRPGRRRSGARVGAGPVRPGGRAAAQLPAGHRVDRGRRRGGGGRRSGAGRRRREDRGGAIAHPAYPLAATPAKPIPTGADLSVPGLSPYVTPNATFYRIDTALQVPVIDPDEWTLQGLRAGRAGGHDHLRRPAGPAVDRAHDHAHVRVQRGRRQSGRQRDLARPADPRPAGRGTAAARSRHGAVQEPRRLDGGNAARRAAGERTASACWPWR